jgi:hypothetical protein
MASVGVHGFHAFPYDSRTLLAEDSIPAAFANPTSSEAGPCVPLCGHARTEVGQHERVAPAGYFESRTAEAVGDTSAGLGASTTGASQRSGAGEALGGNTAGFIELVEICAALPPEARARVLAMVRASRE